MSKRMLLRSSDFALGEPFVILRCLSLHRRPTFSNTIDRGHGREPICEYDPDEQC